MIKKHIVVLGLALLSFLLLFGCSSTLSDSQETGSLVVGKSDGRALDVNTIKQAKVTITGNDSNGGKITPITENVLGVSDGVGSFVITRIPIGKNRIVTVEGFDDDGNAIAGAVLRAVVDINAGFNTIDKISWITSRKGYVYNALFEDGVNVSEVDESTDGHIPECAPASINLTEFVKDYKDNNLKPKDSYIIASVAELSYVKVSGDLPNLKATAYYTDGTDKDVTNSVQWESSASAVATVLKGVVTLVSAGKTEITVTYTDGGVTKKGAVQTVTVTESTASLVVYMDAGYGEVSGGGYFYGWKGESKPFGNWPGTKMTLTDDKKAYYFIIEDTGAVEFIIINNNSKQTENLTLPGTDGHWLCYYAASKWDWKEYTGTKVAVPGGGELTATIESEVVTYPAKPTVTISPADGKTVSLSGKITVSFIANNDAIVSKIVKINGESKTVSGNSFSINVSDITDKENATITVEANATSSMGKTEARATLTTTDTTVVEDTFTWDNVNAYFVLTDRFYNGNTSNDASYGRQRKSGDEDVATFHGGDLKGLTEKIDYFDKLGVNAIWITAPYEQAHGWVGGKDGKFPHYAFHGYYTLDWTALDANMGTLDEFREFVVACHKKGIRVIMDVVMNHVGYNNQADMITYKHGKTSQTSATWLEKTNGKWDANVGVDFNNQYWESWWGPWIRSFGYKSGSEYGGSCGGLPDVKSELTSSVGMAPVMKTKWSVDSSDIKKKYYNPSVANADWNGYSGDYRTDKGIAPADYQVVWLSAWVREFGIDGFRCDTAKHVEPFRWGQLKVACQAALEAWRKDNSKADDSGAKDWDENFWMTGECWGWTSISGGGEYYSTGKFDSMINFSFNGGNNWDGNYRTKYPGTSDWNSYLSINNNGDSDSNGNRDNVLSYISSHDTGLTRTNNQKEVGTGLILLPGGVQIYYGDESSREKAYTGCGDGDMFTRGDMNWDNQDLVAHWGKVGNFRKYNPAVGAGKGSAMKRTYSGSAGESKVAIGVNGTSVDVSGLFDNGTTVYNWYDGKSAQVLNGKVTFEGGNMSQPILVSDKNPADFGLSF